MLDEQIAYYRRRAAEYDATAYRDLPAAQREIARIVAGFGPTGDLLEIACGTGIWTQALARHARTVTALDSAPEMVAAARQRVAGVDVVVGDAFGYDPGRRFDTVFFAFWLSHVPDVVFDGFWARVRGWLVPGGRAVFVDEMPVVAPKESYVDGQPHVVERGLADGSTYHIVKVFRDGTELAGRLARLGWTAAVRPVPAQWLAGEAR
jgi:SAM-dependent methyltransferase